MSAKSKLIILGTRTFAEEVADLITECEEYELVAFAENWDRDRCGRLLLGCPVIWVEELAPFALTHQAVCAIGTTRRSLFVNQVERMGFKFPSVRHPSARVSRTTTVGAGSILSVGVIIAAQAMLGRHVIVNRGCLIGHHSAIGDYVTISPGANIAGSVSVGAGTYIGMGAVILDHITIGSNSVVGAGAVVTNDVPDNVEVVGLPARITKKDVTGR